MAAPRHDLEGPPQHGPNRNVSFAESETISLMKAVVYNNLPFEKGNVAMNRRKTIVQSIFALGIGISLAHGQSEAEKYEDFYRQWHRAVESYPVLNPSGWFDSDHGPEDLRAVVKEIKSHKIAFAHFLCERLANTQYQVDRVRPMSPLYRDVSLLRVVAGVDLILADDKITYDQNIDQNIVRFTAQFQRDWKAGVYADPGAIVARLCAERMTKPATGALQEFELSLVAIRRYGIFALPELISQIKTHNSRHAFVAAIAVMNECTQEEYFAYRDRTDELYAKPADKLAEFKKKYELWRSKGGGGEEFDVVKRTNAALGR